ncbi:cache domain-containing protein, partial [Bradyrhizobium sp.]|uniref:cache domain-containing protein n=1 Tax=Bradyrhizobium sp. TaxID=376 RepID=UPI001EB8234E
MTLLSNLKIHTKFASMVILAALAVCTTVAVAASLTRARMVNDRIEQLHTAVDLLYGQAQMLQDEVVAGKMTVDQAKAEFRRIGHHMKFNSGQAYPIAHTIADSSVLLNGADEKMEGKVLGMKDANGVLISEAQISAGRQSPEGGTSSYLYPRPGQTEPLRKLVFGRIFAPWNISMSFGLYVDDIESDVDALLWRLGT